LYSRKRGNYLGGGGGEENWGGNGEGIEGNVSIRS